MKTIMEWTWMIAWRLAYIFLLMFLFAIFAK